MEKYQQMIYKRIYDMFQKWDELEAIFEQEMYRFLHTVKGTAGSIGLKELSDIASEKLQSLEETSEKQWRKDEWKGYLSPIIEAMGFYKTNYTIQNVDNLSPHLVTYNTANREFILVIDDDVIFISYLKSVLEEQGHAVIVAHNGKRGLELIYELRPSIVFIDIMLPDINGFSILENIGKINKERMFVAVMSVNDSKENRKRAYDMGALDFIAKPIDQDILVAYVTNRLKYRKELEHSIIIDELTQVYNRKFMDAALQKLIQYYPHNAEPFSVVLADIDFFKKVNDTYGHLIGDEVLKGFATLMVNNKRELDMFCRYGGEEFIFLMPQTTAEEACKLMEDHRRLMEQQTFNSDGTTFHVTFSAGVVEATTSNLHAKKLLEEADQALYHAKQSGRNQTAMFKHIAGGNKKRVKIKVIVIDDVSVIRSLITNYFKNWEPSESFEVEVLSFSDGVSFLQADWYTENSKHIILLDGIMPKMDGIEVLKKIREHYTSSDVIVSMLTGRKGDEYVLQAFENGADDYIIKPFNIVNVSDRIFSLVNRLFV